MVAAMESKKRERIIFIVFLCASCFVALYVLFHGLPEWVDSREPWRIALSQFGK